MPIGFGDRALEGEDTCSGGRLEAHLWRLASLLVLVNPVASLVGEPTLALHDAISVCISRAFFTPVVLGLGAGFSAAGNRLYLSSQSIEETLVWYVFEGLI
jgi:hypothetical protein